jgi:hypothetical protein
VRRPNNLPFSSRRGERFEDQIAELFARDLHAGPRDDGFPPSRGCARKTLETGTCYVILGVSAPYDPVLTTKPYDRSTYVFLTQPAGPLGGRGGARPGGRGHHYATQAEHRDDTHCSGALIVRPTYRSTHIAACAVALTAAVADCNRKARSTIGRGPAAATGATDTGMVQTAALRPFCGDPAQARRGRFLSVEYNCHGCHGGSPAAPWARASAIPCGSAVARTSK